MPYRGIIRGVVRDIRPCGNSETSRVSFVDVEVLPIYSSVAPPVVTFVIHTSVAEKKLPVGKHIDLKEDRGMWFPAWV